MRIAVLMMMLLLAATAPAADALDAELYASILAANTVSVDDIASTRVDYLALQKSVPGELRIRSLRDSDPTRLGSQSERLAFWINAYNTLAIDLVRRHYPVQSIRSIGSLLSPVWTQPAGEIGGRTYSLDQIEKEMLHGMGEPRIHGAIVCASLSCPPLRREPYRAAELDAQLDDNIRRWLADPRKGKPDKPFERRFGEPEAKAQENFTDPDSRIMKRGSSGFEQCYNAQIAVDETERIIVATGVTQSAADAEQLIPLLDQVEENTGEQAARCLADAGYRSESNLQALESRRIDGYVAMGREKDGAATVPSATLAATCRMRRKLATKRGREIHRKRKWIGEPPFSWIKSAMGFDRFHLRGLTKVTSEWDLACLAANLRRMHGKVALG